MYTEEKEIGRQAERMLESSLRQKTSTFKNHVQKSDSPSLKDATAVTKYKQYGRVRAGTKAYYMRKLSIKMARHGFIQHFGVNAVRAGGSRNRERPKNTTYRFKAHVMSMPAKPFINQAVDNSGVVNFVLNNVTRIRSEEILVDVKRILEHPGS